MVIPSYNLYTYLLTGGVGQYLHCLDFLLHL